MTRAKELRDLLEKQGAVALAYSPLCSAVLRAVQAKLDDGDTPLAALIVDYYERVLAATELEKSLRLAGVLHYYVLIDDPRVAALRPYYSTVDGTEDPKTPAFEAVVVDAIVELGAELFERALAWRVQTNETARGLAWLLPLALLDVDAAHLVELGASAGLNMYADQRRFDLSEGEKTWTLGHAASTQFQIPVHGLDIGDIELQTPEVLSRHGGDINPVDFRDAAAMDGLRACIWGDQPERFRRLEEGLAMHREALLGRRGAAPAVTLHKSELPGELEDLLRVALPARPEAPIVLFNTYVTAYFSDVEHRELQRKIRQFAHQHALTHRIPWVWIRFEPRRRGEPAGPHPAWCRWRIELWHEGKEHRFELGWAHPHMAEIEFSPNLSDLLALR